MSNSDKKKNGGSDCSRFTFKYAIGLISLILVVVFWVLSGFLTNEILKTYQKPVFMCFLSCVSFLLYFIFWFVEDPVNLLSKQDSKETSLNHEEEQSDIKHTHVLAPFTKSQLSKIGFIFFLLYFPSNAITNIAFQSPSVTTVSIIASTSGFFTLVFGWCMGVEVLSILRILSILVGVGGILLLSFRDFLNESSQLYFNLFALFSAILYGVYSTYLKRIAIDESRLSMPVLFSFVGLYTLIFSIPLFYVLHIYKLEIFELPSGRIAFGLLLNAILGGFVPNYLWNVAFVCTSPLVVAIGLSSIIPLTTCIDYFRGGQITWNMIGSGICVVIGFVFVNLANVMPQLDLRAEKFLANIGIMNEEDVKSTEERAARQRSELIKSRSSNSSSSLPTQE